MGVRDPGRYPEFLCGCKRPVEISEILCGCKRPVEISKISVDVRGSSVGRKVLLLERENTRSFYHKDLELSDKSRE